jgi:hypothetical protein
VIDEIISSKTAINPTLYNEYSSNLRKAVDRVFAEDNDSGLSDQLRANVSRFAAYKAYHATEQVREQVKQDGVLDEGKKVLHAFNRYQAAEYNTTVGRCRSAKQFAEFLESDNARLFPNLRWLPSRSATPREEHMAFYDRVWAKDDPFWDTNQPANLWNCKCDWEETSDACTSDNPNTPIRHNGLEGNPARTGEVFTDKCSYVKGAGTNKKEKSKIEKLCQLANKRQIEHLIPKTNTTCTINGKKFDVGFDVGFNEVTQSMLGDKNVFWLKNQILPTIQKYIQNAEYIGRKRSDHTHNSRKETIRLKKATEHFYYFQSKLPNGQNICIQIGKYKPEKKGGAHYFYTITKNIPEGIE